MPELWPIAEYPCCDDDQEANDRFRVYSSTGRMQCKACHSLFCSQYCRKLFDERMGSCCDCANAVKAAVRMMNPEPHNNYASNDEISEIQPAIILATRMFVSFLYRYRTAGDQGLGPFEGLCGSADDITPLELGLYESETRHFTLKTTYNAVCESLKITDNERRYLSQDLFHRLAAIAARNGFAVKTQSPFRPFYAALLRAAGGRQTDRHVALLQQVATALGSTDGTLQRDMDRKVEERVSAVIITSK